MVIDEDAYLEHYGVLGMHWGIRNDKERQARRESKAQKFIKKGNDLQKVLDQISKSDASTSFRRAQINKKKFDIRQAQRQAERDANAKRNGHLTDRQRKMLIGGAVVGGLLLAGGALYLANSGEINRSIIKGAAFIKNHGNLKEGEALWKKRPDLSGPKSTEEIFKDVVKPINRGYHGGLGIGATKNCRRCTFAYELRRRGYDVAATRTTKGTGQTAVGLYNALSPGEKIINTTPGALSKISKEGKNTRFAKVLAENIGLNDIPRGAKEAAPTSIFKALAKQPSGSRGELGIIWSSGGGHSMAYEVVKGKPVVFDTQTGKMFKNADELLKSGGDLIDKAKFTRLDNVDLNNDFLLRWAKNA